MNQAAAAAQPQTTASGSNLELNKGDQFLFALDVSRSMGTTDCPGGVSRIQPDEIIQAYKAQEHPAVVAAMSKAEGVKNGG